MTIKISQMTPKAGALSGNELLEITDGSATRRVTAQQLADLLRTPTTREIDLSVSGDDENNRKILLEDRHNVVRFTGGCGFLSIFIHDDVMAQDNFRFTLVIPNGSYNQSGTAYLNIYYWDGASATRTHRLYGEDMENARDLAYDILISGGEIIVPGNYDSDQAPPS